MHPTIKIQTSSPAAHESREDTNNRSMLAPAPRLDSGLTLRPISLGSLEILRQLGNPLAAAETQLTEIDSRALTEFLWVHAAPVETVLDLVYTTPSRVPRAVAEFALSVKPTELSRIMTALVADRAGIEAASAAPLPDPDMPESPNEPARLP